MSRLYGPLQAEQIRLRAAALSRFEAWEQSHPARRSPASAIAGIASLYELLPLGSRAREVDPSGVAAMHEALSALRRVG